MPLIHLARHGHHDEVGRVLSGRSDIALSVAGTREAQELAGLLAGTQLASIHSSPRRRTMQTAEAVAMRKELAILPAPELDEIDFGAFTGRTFGELEGDVAWGRWNAERATCRCPGGETMKDVTERACRFIFSLAARDEPALCVTHCDVIRAVVAHVLGLATDRIFMIDCDPASLTTLSIEGGAVRLVTLNRRAGP
ncbi:histidine phosphatase family protein [Novosphingobium panipatense]|jgi:broad specificity phosphatase PhoE|uniref:histidine phosphatase family protein n=1 Tax=Novosphingobium TaxID=165696 RepID=UPI000CDA6503|nr:histidine phosphatase family protein [Novosphingobium sp. HII-3]